VRDKEDSGAASAGLAVPFLIAAVWLAIAGPPVVVGLTLLGLRPAVGIPLFAAIGSLFLLAMLAAERRCRPGAWIGLVVAFMASCLNVDHVTLPPGSGWLLALTAITLVIQLGMLAVNVWAVARE
jgi:hypothetical protein